jgi:hypothetical protein
MTELDGGEEAKRRSVLLSCATLFTARMLNESTQTQ